MPDPVWYRSLYWRIALGFVALLASLLVVQGLVFLWMTGRMTDLFPNRSPAQLAGFATYREPRFVPRSVSNMRGTASSAVSQGALNIDTWDFDAATDEFRPCTDRSCPPQLLPHGVVNPGYFTAGLEPTIPQVFKVTLKIDVNADGTARSPEDERFRDAIMNKLDLAAFVGLIDKR